MPFPSPPWRLRARAWVSVFAVRRTAGRPGGLYAAALVDYQQGGVLAYHELLVARLVGVGTVRITDIWVDSAQSLAGGRALWAIPKQPADLSLTGSAEAVSFEAGAAGVSLARGSFRPLRPELPVRVPFAARTSQQREDASGVTTPFRGAGRVAACRSSWRFGPDGPLGFLAGRRPLLSLALTDVSLRFG